MKGIIIIIIIIISERNANELFINSHVVVVWFVEEAWLDESEGAFGCWECASVC